MYKAVIIPGKNWLISLAEIIAFLEARNYKFHIESLSKDFFVFQFGKKIDPSIINELGGIIKIGEINTSFSTDSLKRAICKRDKAAKKDIIATISQNSKILDSLANSTKKLIFGVSTYCSDKKLHKITKSSHRFFGSIIKKKLAEQGKKSRFMGFPKDRRLSQLSHIEVIKKELIENNAEFLISINRNQTWLSTTKAVHNPFEFQKRDIEKPIQRKIFAMPPRLAKILINLSLCDQKRVLLDPFCGVGSILQEGLLNKSRVIGVDINPWCIEASERNLKWLIKNYEIKKPEFRVMQGDIQDLSKKIGYEKIDCVATEPDLGPALRQVPTKAYAEKIIKKLDRLYYFFLRETYKVLKKNCRCVFVTPYLKTRSGSIVRMNLDEKAKKIGFTRVFPIKKAKVAKEELLKISSLTDFNRRHKTGREIHIFKK